MKTWRMRAPARDSTSPMLADELNISPLFLDILQKRGLDTPKLIDDYLNARLAGLTPPDKWPHIPEAAAILAAGLLAGKKLAVWGDYDVDGITATTLCLDVFEEHGFQVLHHLPHRMSEGYGLNVEGIETLARSGCRMLLTVDCGISNNEAVERARELGMTVVISDHHMPPPNPPDADIIVNPRMPGDWPCVNLAGVGVAFYLMAKVNALLSEKTGRRYKMDNALDLVALGTLADVVELEGENRLLVRGGLARMEKARRFGISALKEVSSLAMSEKIGSTQAAFRLAPRINAAGRMDHAELALNLLRSRDPVSARTFARELDEKNSDRKARGAQMFTEAREQAKTLLRQKDYAALVLCDAGWHPGIVGIVASRIVEEFNRPCIVLCEDKGALKGSGRSVPGFNLYGGLSATARFLSGFGGHRQAAGLRLEKKNLNAFREAFAAAARACLGPNPAPPVLTLDCELTFAEARNAVFLRELELMEPFGAGNEEPVFASPPLEVLGRRELGQSREHVQLELRDKKSGVVLKPKAWRMAAQFPPDIVGQEIKIAYTPKMETFRGLPTVELEIHDWRKCNADSEAPSLKRPHISNSG